MGARFPVWCARLRMPLLSGAVAFLVGGGFLGGPAWMGPAGLVLLLAGLALYFRVGTVRRPRSRWPPQLLAELRAGEQVAECGNSGNTTEPHLHFQLMDHRSVPFGAGLPFQLASFEVDGMVQAGVPANGRPFTTDPPRQEAGERR